MKAHARPPLLPGFLLSCDRDKSEKVEISEERQHSQAKKQATKQSKCGAHHSTHVSGLLGIYDGGVWNITKASAGITGFTMFLRENSMFHSGPEKA